MKYIWRAFKAFIPVAYTIKKKPLNFAYEISEQQIQTTINKIFLTSQHSEFSDLKIFAFDAQSLGRQITSHLDITLSRHQTDRFNDGQVSLQLLESVRGHKVFIVKSFENKNINDGLIQLLLAVSCMKKCGAESVTCIIPYFPYSSTPMVNQGRDFYTCFASDIVKMLQESGCNTIVTLNSPMSSPKGFARSAAFMNIQAPQIVVPYLIHTKIKNPVLIGAQSDKIYLRNIHKLKNSFSLFNYHCQMGFFNEKDYIGSDVKGKDILLFNNLIRTGESIRYQVKKLKQKGAKNIYCYGFHGLCSNELLDKLIEELPIKELILTNSIFQAEQSKKIRTISLAKLLAEIITIIKEEKSLTEYRAQREMINYAYLQKIKSFNIHDSLNDSEEPSEHSHDSLFQKVGEI